MQQPGASTPHTADKTQAPREKGMVGKGCFLRCGLQGQDKIHSSSHENGHSQAKQLKPPRSTISWCCSNRHGQWCNQQWTTNPMLTSNRGGVLNKTPCGFDSWHPQASPCQILLRGSCGRPSLLNGHLHTGQEPCPVRNLPPVPSVSLQGWLCLSKEISHCKKEWKPEIEKMVLSCRLTKSLSSSSHGLLLSPAATRDFRVGNAAVRSL